MKAVILPGELEEKYFKTVHSFRRKMSHISFPMILPFPAERQKKKYSILY